jgi:hypothetical protein
MGMELASDHFFGLAREFLPARQAFNGLVLANTREASLSTASNALFCVPCRVKSVVLLELKKGLLFAHHLVAISVTHLLHTTRTTDNMCKIWDVLPAFGRK